MILQPHEAQIILETFGPHTFLYNKQPEGLMEEAEKYADFQSFMYALLTSESTVEWGCIDSETPSHVVEAIVNKLSVLSLSVGNLTAKLEEGRKRK